MGFLECLTKRRRERPFRQQKSTTPPTGKTVWAIVFTVWATEKTVAQTVNPLSDNKKEPPRGLYPALHGKDTTSKGEMQIGRRRRFIYEIAISQNNFLFYRAPSAAPLPAIDGTMRVTCCSWLILLRFSPPVAQNVADYKYICSKFCNGRCTQHAAQVPSLVFLQYVMLPEAGHT